MAWAEGVGAQGRATAPEAPAALHCPRGSWIEACMYVFEEVGEPWWHWRTSCVHLLKDRMEETKEGEVMKPVSQKGGDI